MRNLIEGYVGVLEWKEGRTTSRLVLAFVDPRSVLEGHLAQNPVLMWNGNKSAKLMIEKPPRRQIYRVFERVSCLWLHQYLEREFGWIKRILGEKFMHDPISFGALWGSTLVEHQCLPRADKHTLSGNHAVLSCCLPITWLCRSVRSTTRCILAVSETEEVPLLTPNTCHFYLITTTTTTTINIQ